MLHFLPLDITIVIDGYGGFPSLQLLVLKDYSRTFITNPIKVNFEVTLRVQALGPLYNCFSGKEFRDREAGMFRKHQLFTTDMIHNPSSHKSFEAYQIWQRVGAHVQRVPKIWEQRVIFHSVQNRQWLMQTRSRRWTADHAGYFNYYRN